MINKKPLVSIVIPTFNCAQYLEEAIESVLAQTYSNIELIVLDDGSTDNTKEILKNYNNRFYWETHENMGQSRTINKGWTMSKGEIISYLSSDDLLLPNAVENAVACLTNSNYVVTYCDYNLIDPDSKVIKKVTPPDFNYYDMAVNLICQPGPGVFIRKSVFDEIGGWNENLKQMPDLDYWLRAGTIGEFKHLSTVDAHYRVHNSSQTFAKVNIEKAKEPVIVANRLFNSDLKLPDSIIMAKAKAFSNAHIQTARLHFRSCRYLMGLSELMIGLRLSPSNFFKKSTLKLIINGLISRPIYQIKWKLKKK